MKHLRQTSFQVPLVALALIVLFPLYFPVVNSFKSNAEFLRSPAALPESPTMRAYTEAVAGRGVGLLFLNSAIISVSAVTIATVFGAMAAYAIAKMDFRGRSLAFNSLLPLMVIPPIAILVPQFVLFGRLGLVGHRASVILIYVGIMLPFTVYLLRNFFLGIPNDIIDSAKLDGAGPWTAFWRIVLPLARPGLITAAIVNFVFAWNELLISLVFLQNENSRTLVVGLTIFRSRLTLDVPVLMAGLTVATVPVVLIYAFGQRYLVRGLLSGIGK